MRAENAWSRGRVKRKDEQQRDMRRQALGLPDTVPLLPESPADARAAALVTFGDARAFEKARRQSRDAIKQGSIFSPGAVAAGRQQVAKAAAARAREDAAALAAEAAARLGTAAGGGGLPRRVAVLQRSSETAAPASTVERRDRGSLSKLGKPPVAHRAVSTLKAQAAGTRLHPSSAPGTSAPRSGIGEAGARCGPVTLKRASTAAAAQLALKRRRLEHGVKLSLSEPRQGG